MTSYDCDTSYPAGSASRQSVMLAVMFFLLITPNAFAKPQPAQVAAPDSQNPSAGRNAGGPADGSTVPPEAIDQINALRRQMGGGVAKQLEGLFEDPAAAKEQLQGEFDRQLNKLLVDRERAMAVQPLPSANSLERIRCAIRTAARELDAVSADLEDVELYLEADQIRASAKKLRLRARMTIAGRSARSLPPSVENAPVEQLPLTSNQPSERFRLPAKATDPKIRPRQ